MALPPAALLRLAARAVPIPDAELLARFTEARDAEAFAELVRRHGPAAYRVCRRIAGPADADDAFQATFLVFATRAGSVRTAGSVGGWLVGVAGRVARQMRTARLRRERHERASGAVHPRRPDSLDLTEHSRILDEELARLPDRLRGPVVACLVQGRTQEQAAADLGGSIRTIRRRLDEAKRLLKARLERRGVVPAVAAGLAAGAGEGATAVPPPLTAKTVAVVFDFLAGGAATAAPPAVIAKGVATAMIARKLAVVMAAAAVGLTGLGIGLTRVGAGDGPDPAAKPAEAAKATAVNDRIQPRSEVPPGPEPKEPVRILTDNFVVTAPTEVLAKLFGETAERHRREKAIQWLGAEMPRWSRPCLLDVEATPGRNGGATTFTFGHSDKPAVVSQNMKVFGDVDRMLASTLPHEVMHTVLAHHFGRAVPRWADEGISVLSETEEEQRSHDVRCRQIIEQGRSISLRNLFPMKEYPRDMMALFTQGHSVCRFLMTRELPMWDLHIQEDGRVDRSIPGGRVYGTNILDDATRDTSASRLLKFVQIGMLADWNQAAIHGYGFDSVDALEEAWLAWVKQTTPATNPPPAWTPSQQPRPEPNPPGPANAEMSKLAITVSGGSPAINRAIEHELRYQWGLQNAVWFGEATGPVPVSGVFVEYAEQATATVPDTYATTAYTAGLDGRLTAKHTKATLIGEMKEVLEQALPYAAGHIALAARFTNPRVPHWAIEGMSISAMSDAAQAGHDAYCRGLLEQGHAVRLASLFNTVSLKDQAAFYAQTHSVIRFLRTRTPVAADRLNRESAVVEFVRRGAEGWDKAAKEVYGFENVNALEEAWITWMKTPASRLVGNGSAPVSNPALVELPPLIPPVKLNEAGSSKEEPDRVGKITILGDAPPDRDKLIQELRLYPGEVLDYSRLDRIRKEIAYVFEVSNRYSDYEPPTVTVLPSRERSRFRDIEVLVKKKGARGAKAP